MGLCHGIIMTKGGSEELEALNAATSSKFAAAPPSREALAAMGEDGSGLSFDKFMQRLGNPGTAAGAAEDGDAHGDGKRWEETTAGGAGMNHSALHDSRVPAALRIPV